MYKWISLGSNRAQEDGDLLRTSPPPYHLPQGQGQVLLDTICHIIQRHTFLIGPNGVLVREKLFEMTVFPCHYNSAEHANQKWQIRNPILIAGPTPAWRGVKAIRASPLTTWEIYLEVSLHSISPTALGCKPPLFLLTARRLAPHRCRMTSART